jgi:O-antigen/teichoic acid export membrane protein
VKRSAIGAIAAQGSQALASFVLQVLVARLLGFEGLGAFAILYGIIVLASAVLSGFVGDSLVVLDRDNRVVRSALEQYALGLSTLAGLVAASIVWLTGLISLAEAALFAAAIVAFCLEELLRRMLMAHLSFWKVAIVDMVGFVVALAVLGIWSLVAPIVLSSFLAAITIGQLVALFFAAAVLPRTDRYLVAFVRGGFGEVAAYGTWRSLQQLLRPAMLTGVRTLVTIFAGLAATGLLEAARTYVAPALLIIGGLSSFLFVSFAKDKSRPVRELLRRADKAVLALLAGTVAIGVVAVLALPVAGPLLFPETPDLVAVLGWLAYAASVAAVTPYGALAAVGGKQAVVFGVRVGDTIVSIVAVATALALGMGVPLVAVVLSVGSILGGAAIRFFILAPLARRGTPDGDGAVTD